MQYFIYFLCNILHFFSIWAQKRAKDALPSPIMCLSAVSVLVSLPYPAYYPQAQRPQHHIPQRHPNMMPPCEPCGHLHLHRVGAGHSVSLRYVCCVVMPAVTPTGVPAFYVHGVARLADMDRVMHIDAVALVPCEVGCVCPVLHHGHILRRRATRKQPYKQGCNNEHQITPNQSHYPGLLFVMVIPFLRLVVLALVMNKRAANTLSVAIVYTVGVVAVMVTTIPTIVNSSLHRAK